MDNYKKRGICEACGWEGRLNENDTCRYCDDKYKSSLLYLYLYDMDKYIEKMKLYGNI